MVRNAVRMLSYSLYSSLGRRNGGGRKCVTNGKENNSLVAKCHELPHEHRRDPRVSLLPGGCGSYKYDTPLRSTVR